MSAIFKVQSRAGAQGSVLWFAKIPNMLIMRDFEAHRPGPEPDDLGAMVRAYIAYYQHRWCVTLMWRQSVIE